jgi:hypothetical protein
VDNGELPVDVRSAFRGMWLASMSKVTPDSELIFTSSLRGEGC